MRLPEVAEHLDSGKVLAMAGSWAEPVLHVFRRDDAVEPMTDEPGG